VVRKRPTGKVRKKIRKTLGLIAGLTKTPSTAKDFRGFAAEEKALKAARYWQKKKIILNVRQTKGLSPEDREMKDLILVLLDGREVAVQVKNHLPKFSVVKSCREKGILLLTIWAEEDREVAKSKMLNLIISAYLSGLEPFQMRQIISKIGELRQLPLPSKKPTLIKAILTGLRRVFS
jgi:hypothetical protein